MSNEHCLSSNNNNDDIKSEPRNSTVQQELKSQMSDPNYLLIKKEDKYHLLNNVDADIYTYTIVGIYATTLDDFTIETIEDGYLFTNIGEDEKIEVEFKNIGNTSLPYEIN